MFRCAVLRLPPTGPAEHICRRVHSLPGAVAKQTLAFAAARATDAARAVARSPTRLAGSAGRPGARLAASGSSGGRTNPGGLEDLLDQEQIVEQAAWARELVTDALARALPELRR